MRSEELEKQAVREGDHWWFQARRSLLGYGFERVGTSQGLRILEIGSATGGNEAVCRRFGHYHALDLSPKALDICRHRGIERLVCGDAQSIPFDGKTFDVVVAFDIFEHLTKDEDSLSEISRVLKPGGVLLANVPAFQRLFSAHDFAFDHVRRYQPGELDRKLRNAGFQTVQRSYWSFFIFPAVFLVRSLRKPPLPGSPGKSDFDHPPPKVIDWMMKLLANLEFFLIRRGIPLPFGVSYFCIARTRPRGSEKE